MTVSKKNNYLTCVAMFLNLLTKLFLRFTIFSALITGIAFIFDLNNDPKQNLLISLAFTTAALMYYLSKEKFENTGKTMFELKESMRINTGKAIFVALFLASSSYTLLIAAIGYYSVIPINIGTVFLIWAMTMLIGYIQSHLSLELEN